MFGYWKKIKEIEKKNDELFKRVEALEEYVYGLKVNEVLKEYSEKYGIEIKLQRSLFNGQYYLDTKEKTICKLPCRGEMGEVYREIHNVEKNIKAFMYDIEKSKDAVKETVEKIVERDGLGNDKE